MPRKVTEVRGNKAKLQDGRWVRLDLTGPVKPGDMVLAQADMAIEKVAKTHSKQMKVLLEE